MSQPVMDIEAKLREQGDIEERLRLPVSESMFVRRSDMLRALFAERAEAADTIATLRKQVSDAVGAWQPIETAPESGFFLAWSPDFPDMVSCWKAELLHQARKPGTPRHLSANHFTLWRALDLPAALASLKGEADA